MVTFDNIGNRSQFDVFNNTNTTLFNFFAISYLFNVSTFFLSSLDFNPKDEPTLMFNNQHHLTEFSIVFAVCFEIKLITATTRYKSRPGILKYKYY